MSTGRALAFSILLFAAATPRHARAQAFDFATCSTATTSATTCTATTGSCCTLPATAGADTALYAGSADEAQRLSQAASTATGPGVDPIALPRSSRKLWTRTM